MEMEWSDGNNPSCVWEEAFSFIKYTVELLFYSSTVQGSKRQCMCMFGLAFLVDLDIGSLPFDFSSHPIKIFSILLWLYKILVFESNCS